MPTDNVAFRLLKRVSERRQLVFKSAAQLPPCVIQRFLKVGKGFCSHGVQP